MNYLDIPLKDHDNVTVTLRNYLGKKIVLYFYPKDNTPGCTVESIAFSKLKADFLDKDYMIIGVSADSVKSHQKFRTQHHLDITLLSDTKKELLEAFQVLVEKSMFGKKYMGIERSTFLLDEQGNIVKEYRKVSPTEHPKALLEEL